MGEGAEEDPVRRVDENEDMYDNRHKIINKNSMCDILEQYPDHYSEAAFKETKEGKIRRDENTDLDLQILEMIEKSDGVWKCKICGRTTIKKDRIREHAESHIEGMSHTCHICRKSYPNRNTLRCHINNVHSGLFSCDVCGKSGMNKGSYYEHTQTKQHKTLSGTLS